MSAGLCTTPAGRSSITPGSWRGCVKFFECHEKGEAVFVKFLFPEQGLLVRAALVEVIYTIAKVIVQSRNDDG